MSAPRGSLFVLLVVAACGRTPPPSTPPPGGQERTAAQDQPTREEGCRNAAKACGDAVMSRRNEQVIDCMPGEALAFYGGRAAVLAALIRGTGQMADKGISIENVELGVPSKLVPAKDKLFAVVPQSVTMKGPAGRLRTHTFLVGVSADGGGSWKFVNGAALTREKLAKMFPMVPDEFTLPEVLPPERLP